jgi:hypothetical protein
MKRSTILAAACTVTLALAVACGGPKDAPATPAATPASAAGGSTATAAAGRPTTAPAAAAPTAASTSAAAPASGATAPAGAPAAGRGRGTPPPPPPPPPAVMPAPAKATVSATTPSPDPRVGLKAGLWDAAQAAWNLQLISTTPPGPKVLGSTHSDLAFSGQYVIQGNYNGFEIYDVSNPAMPKLAQTYLCPASQNDVSVYKNLVFMSSESGNSHADCSFGPIPDPISKDRVRGVRIFDISNIASPKLVASVQTCRGSHTHTLLTPVNDPDNVYIYVSGTSGVRSADELPGCTDSGRGVNDAATAQFRLEVIKVPLAHPDQAAIVSSPRIFNDLPAAPANPDRAAVDRAGRPTPPAGAPPAGGGRGAAPAGPPPPPTGPNQCHDITVYPAVGLAGGACAGLGLLLDIHDPAHPTRLAFASDANMSFWHSATFSNDGTKILFTDEWGGGSAPRCRDTDKMEWGADALFTIENGKLVFHTYYKMPAAQTAFENCVAHNGSLLPIPGREVMIQSWYQGGVSLFDWTDVNHPKEIGFFDRGPNDGTRLMSGGTWSAYWYNGHIYSSEIQRGLDVIDVLPGGLISQNELDAAKTVHVAYLNVQDQQKFVWPPSFALARAYVDQLERSKGLSNARLTDVRNQLTAAEKASGATRQTALTQLATSLNSDAGTSSDGAKVKLLIAAVGDLAK